MAVERSAGHVREEPRVQTLWFWTVFSAGVFIIACLILFAGIRKTTAAANWTRTPDETLLPFFVQDSTGRVLVVPFGAQLILPDNRMTCSNRLGSLSDQAVAGLRRLGISRDGWWLGQKTLRCSEACILPDEIVYVLGVAHEMTGDAGIAENAARLYIGSAAFVCACKARPTKASFTLLSVFT
jgi:hypothetical protein